MLLQFVEFLAFEDKQIHFLFHFLAIFCIKSEPALYYLQNDYLHAYVLKYFKIVIFWQLTSRGLRGRVRLERFPGVATQHFGPFCSIKSHWQLLAANQLTLNIGPKNLPRIFHGNFVTGQIFFPKYVPIHYFT